MKSLLNRYPSVNRGPELNHPLSILCSLLFYAAFVYFTAQKVASVYA